MERKYTFNCSYKNDKYVLLCRSWVEDEDGNPIDVKTATSVEDTPEAAFERVKIIYESWQ
jgi:hypothetical protein